MNSLNKCFLEFVSSHISKDPCCNFVPTFDDYRAYVSDITLNCGDQMDSQSSTSVAGDAALSSSAGEHCQYYVIQHVVNQDQLCLTVRAGSCFLHCDKSHVWCTWLYNIAFV